MMRIKSQAVVALAFLTFAAVATIGAQSRSARALAQGRPSAPVEVVSPLPLPVQAAFTPFQAELRTEVPEEEACAATSLPP